MWISEENENSQGQKDCGSQTASGQKESLRLRFKFPKSVRLRKRFEYQRLSKFGYRFHGKVVSFDYRIEGSSCPRLGITVSKKYGNACLRNRFKRVVREAFREIFSSLPQGMAINVHPRFGQKVSKNVLLDDFKLVLRSTSHSC